MPPHPYRIQIQATGRPPSDGDARHLDRVLRAAARAVLTDADAEPGALTIQLVSDAVIRRLNRDFLGHDYATDVLSFPADQDDGDARYFGDLAISMARARAQARAGGHPLDDEFRLLVVHGVLHLLGHDHDTPTHQRRMWRAQARVLTALGASITGPQDVHVRGIRPAGK